MPKQTTKTIKTYSSADLLEAHTLGYEQLADVGVLLNAANQELQSIKNYIGNVYGVPDSCFNSLKRLLAITSGMLDDSVDHNQTMANRYEQELNGGES